MRFDSSGAVSAGMFDETWRRFVVKMATGAGKTKVLSLVLAWSFFHRLYEPDSSLARNFLVIAPEHHRAGPHPQGFRRLANLFSRPRAAGQRLRRPQLARRFSTDAARAGRGARRPQDGQYLPDEHSPRLCWRRDDSARRTTKTRWIISWASGRPARPPKARWTWA